jgi:hypothetical protein
MDVPLLLKLDALILLAFIVLIILLPSSLAL